MFDSFAHLLSDALHALVYPKKEHLDPADLTRAAFQALAFFGLDGQMSEYSRVSKTVPLPSGQREFLLSAAPDIALPSYIERKVGNVPHESWEWIPLVRNSVVEEARTKGWAVATLVREEQGFRIVLSYEPQTEHRLRYYSDPVTVGHKDDPLPIPSRYGFMITAKTVINAAPMILARAAQLPEEQQLSLAEINALTAVVGHAQAELKEWRELWDDEKTRDRSVRGRNRRPLVPRGW